MGYPGCTLLDADGTELPTHVVRGGSSIHRLRPRTGGARPRRHGAYFNLAYSDVTTGTETSCPTAARSEITPPHAVDHEW